MAFSSIHVGLSGLPRRPKEKRKALRDGFIIYRQSRVLEELYGAFQFFPGGGAIRH